MEQRLLEGPKEQRPLIQLPRWDGKLVLAALFFVGYYSLVWQISRHDVPPANVQLIRDQLLVLGPGVGLILGAIFRTTGAEERRDALRSTELQAAISAPPTPLALPAPEVSAAVEEGIRNGLANAEPVEVKPAVARPPSRPMAADGVRRDWLDQPEGGDRDPWPTR